MITTQTFDDIDKALLTDMQQSFPLDHRPFQLLGQKFGVLEQECLERITRLKTRQAIRQICAVLDAQALGYRVMLAAMKVDPDRVHVAAEGIIQYPGLSHAYQLNDPFNLWMTIHVPPSDQPERVARLLQALVKADEMILLPTVRVYKSPGPHDPIDEESWWEYQGDVEGEPPRSASRPTLTAQDLRILRIVQDDLPLLEIPYAVWAEQADCAEEELFAWLRRAEHVGFMDRFAAILYARPSGLLANAMVIWQVPDDQVDAVGEAMAQFREVSYCNRRPVFPHWPYPLLSVIHASTYAACVDAAKRIEERVGRFPHKHLFTTKEYTRRRITYFSPRFETWHDE